MWELWPVGVEISAFALTWHIAYTTACCYRTSRDVNMEDCVKLEQTLTAGELERAELLV